MEIHPGRSQSHLTFIFSSNYFFPFKHLFLTEIFRKECAKKQEHYVNGLSQLMHLESVTFRSL